MMKYADRVFETSTSQGTGTINLAGAEQGYQTFVGGVGDNSNVPYAIFDDTQWEIGRGTVLAGSPDQLQRDFIIESSSGTSAINWGPGTRNVILPVSTNFAVWRDENMNYTGDFGSSSGTANAHILTFSPQRKAYSEGMIVTWAAPADNTNDITANIDGLGAKSYVNADGAEFASGVVKAGHIQQAVYKSGKLYRTTQYIDPTQFATSAQGARADAAVPAVVGSVRNGRMIVPSASASATYTADEVVLQSALGGVGYKRASFSQTINLAATGIGGMDTGTAPINGFVSLYAAYNPATNTNGLFACAATATLSTSAEVYAGANRPAGFTITGLVGVYPTNGSGQLIAGMIFDRGVNFVPIQALSLPGGSTPTTYTPLTLPIPHKACGAWGAHGASNSATLPFGSMASTSSGVGQKTYCAPTIGSGPSLDGFYSGAMEWDMDIVTAQTVHYKGFRNDAPLRITVSGYRF